MSGLNKKLLILAIIISTSALSLYICSFVSTHFFFDKLIYNKSATYGYHPSAWDIIAVKDKVPTLAKRTQDLEQLIAEEENSKVLGSSTANQNVYKIALIGDSFVYGSGIKTEQRFGQILEDKLNKIRPTKVYFLAQPGDNIMDNYAKFLAAQQYIHADLYIFTMVDNDLYFENPNKYPLSQQILTELQGSCPGDVYNTEFRDHLGFAKESHGSETDTRYLPSFSDKYQNNCYLKEISKKIANSGEKEFFFSYNYIPDSEPTDLSLANAKENFMNWKYAKIVQDEQNLVLDASKAPGFTFTSVSPIEGHPSAQTNIYFANSLYQEIASDSKWAFKSDK